MNRLCQGLGLLLLFSLTGPSVAADWRAYELQVRYGELDTPTFAGGGDENTLIFELRYFDSWKYGDNFFFIDSILGKSRQFNDNDVYGELYSNFSLGKIFGKDLAWGPIRDLGVLFGINYGADPKILKYLPGGRLALNLPGFTFANLDMAAFLDDNAGVARGGAPKEGDSFWIDFNWARPFSLGEHEFVFEGHLEYISARDNEFGDTVHWHILGQPQLRYDLGQALFGKRKGLFLGIEFGFWVNKFGDKDTDEFAPQAVLAWVF